MSAFDKVQEAMFAADEAKQHYEHQKGVYQTQIKRACEVMIEGKLSFARRILTDMEFEKQGEDPIAYERLLRAAITKKEPAFELADAFDIEGWKMVQDFVPLEKSVEIVEFFSMAMWRGSSEILKDLIPLYRTAISNWENNWSATQLFGRSDSFDGREDQLIERLKCVDLLLEAGAPSVRLDDVLSRVCQYAREISLAPETLDAMSKSYIAVMEKAVANNRLWMFDADAAHAQPPANLEAARARFDQIKSSQLGADPAEPDEAPAERQSASKKNRP